MFAHAQLRNLNPFPANLGEVLNKVGVETAKFGDSNGILSL